MCRPLVEAHKPGGGLWLARSYINLYRSVLRLLGINTNRRSLRQRGHLSGCPINAPTFATALSSRQSGKPIRVCKHHAGQRTREPQICRGDRHCSACLACHACLARQAAKLCGLIAFDQPVQPYAWLKVKQTSSSLRLLQNTDQRLINNTGFRAAFAANLKANHFQI